jgi:hypothetical protein
MVLPFWLQHLTLSKGFPEKSPQSGRIRSLQVIQLSLIPSDKMVVWREGQAREDGFDLEDFDKRILIDRRKRPTLALSRFAFFGQRRIFRRRSDVERGGYIDKYGLGLFLLLIFIVALNLLDTIFTMIILDYGGWELNPIVRHAIEVYGDKFWIWKFIIMSISLLLLCLHSKFRRVKTIIVAICSVYIFIVLYQIFLIIHKLSTNPR